MLSDDQYIENLEEALEYCQSQINEMDEEIEKLKSDNGYLNDIVEELKQKLARIEKYKMKIYISNIGLEDYVVNEYSREFFVWFNKNYDYDNVQWWSLKTLKDIYDDYHARVC